MLPMLRDRLDRDGFAVVPDVLPPEMVDRLLAAIAAVGSDTTPAGRRSVRRRDAVYAIRNLAEVVPLVREVAASAPVRRLVESVLGPGAAAVQALFLDKPPGANWKITRHRDRTFPVKARVDVPGFGPWSVKAGVPHVQMPEAVLQRLLIVRLHLDPCTEMNGPLRVIPRSHLLDEREHAEERVCLVPRGGALLMRPLLLHASSASRAPGHRRVLHLVFANGPLPGGLAWPDLARCGGGQSA